MSSCQPRSRWSYSRPPGAQQPADVDAAVERGGDGVLRGDVRAEAHVGEELEAFQVLGDRLLRAGDHQPARPEAGEPVRLGHAAHGQDRQVGGEGRGAVVLRAVVQDLVVDLVGEDEQVVPAGDVEQFDQRFPRVHRAGGVVRVDDHDRLGAVADLGPDVLGVRVPVQVFPAAVVHRAAAAEADGAGPQRVVRARHEDLVARVEEGLEGHDDEFGHAVAEEHVVGGDAFDADAVVVGGHRLAGRRDAARVAVALGVRDAGGDLLHAPRPVRPSRTARGCRGSA